MKKKNCEKVTIGVNTHEIKQGDTNYFSIVDPKISNPSHTNSSSKFIFPKEKAHTFDIEISEH